MEKKPTPCTHPLLTGYLAFVRSQTEASIARRENAKVAQVAALSGLYQYASFVMSIT